MAGTSKWCKMVSGFERKGILKTRPPGHDLTGVTGVWYDFSVKFKVRGVEEKNRM